MSDGTRACGYAKSADVVVVADEFSFDLHREIFAFDEVLEVNEF